MLDLATAVAAIRSHPPTKDVVPEWLHAIHAETGVPERDICWVDNRAIFARTISDDAARLIVEACMWRHCEGSGASTRSVSGLDGDWTARWYHISTDTGDDKDFGPDLLAALMFACGVPLPGEAEGRG